jgi:AhpD family alkylhydroperoxidase
MQARMQNIVIVFPDVMTALNALKATAEVGGVPPRTQLLVELRASQINGCSVCVDMHSRELKKAGETDERIFSVAA